MSDALANGQKLRVLTVVDQYTRECVALEVGGHFRGQDVATILTRVGFTRGLPATINVDFGTEFTSRAFDHWAYTNQVQLDFNRMKKHFDLSKYEDVHANADGILSRLRAGNMPCDGAGPAAEVDLFDKWIDDG